MKCSQAASQQNFVAATIQSFILLITILALPVISVADGSENVLVVVNANSTDSLAVANYYIALRNIPSQNVVYLENVPNPDNIVCSLKDFKKSILKPVLETINQRGLAKQIDCIAYSAGIPTAVNIRPHIDILKSKTKIDSRMYSPVASINSLTYYFSDVLRDSPGYLSMQSNWYARRLIKTVQDIAFVGPLQNEYKLATTEYKEGNYEKAYARLVNIVRQQPTQTAARFYIARACARLGKDDDAIRHLQLCAKHGWCYSGLIKNDKAFESIKNRDEFEAVIKACPNILFGQLPTRSFDSQALWAINGGINSTPDQGQRYMLSTVLAVTTGEGCTLPQAISQLKRSASADYTQPRGIFFFSKTADVRSKTRQPQFNVARAELAKLGFKSEVSGRVIPSNRKVLGATLGKADINWAKGRSKFAPGALCDNLTSYGGRMESTSQTKLTHFLVHGAAGASGTVAEPLAIPNKFPDARLHVHYVRGCTLAEAFYQSVQSPFQLLIVGDPLCKPWAGKIKFDVQGLANGDTVKSSLQITTTSGQQNRIREYQLYFDGKKIESFPPNKPLNLNLKDAGDGFHRIQVVAVARGFIASRTGQAFDVTIDQSGHTVKIEIPGTGKYQLKRTLPVTVESSIGEQISVYQNSRKVGSVDGQSGELSLDCKLLGQGPTTLQAVVFHNGKSIASRPLSIQITP